MLKAGVREKNKPFPSSVQPLAKANAFLTFIRCNGIYLLETGGK